ncbi:MAG TPA: redox-sensing transcriptional repressor Rex [Holophaga sp.]|nr:redox-sensing transcriptional repressor Rex [Holophaga sp.]
MAMAHRIGGIPLATVQRLPIYLKVLREMRRAGRQIVSSAALAHLLRLDPVQVRKDFGRLGQAGRPRIGFAIAALIGAIEARLDWGRVNAAVLLGAGHLGQALLGYQGFALHGLEITAAFDPSPRVAGRRLHGIPIHPLEDLEARLPALGARMAILATSPWAAQETAERLALAGIEGIWNFTGEILTLPPRVLVQDQDIAIGLAVLSSRLCTRVGGAPPLSA